jgi:hypothetical protein
MSEREDVLLTALDEAVEAREGTYFRLDYPTERDYAIKQYAEAREAIRRALTPPPRVVVLDEWRVYDVHGGTDVKEMTAYSETDADDCRWYHDKTWPENAPHRVVRVALVEEGVPEANFGNVPPRVVVLDEWAIVDANGKHVNRIRGGSAEYAKGYAADADRFTPEAAPHATLRVALVEEPTTEAPADDA